MNRLLLALVLIGFLALELAYPSRDEATPTRSTQDAMAASSNDTQGAAPAGFIERVVKVARNIL